MALSEKKVLLVIADRDFQDEEYEITKKVLEGRGVKVEVASLLPGEARGAKGTLVKPQVLLDDVKSYNYDAVVFVGGEGARRLSEHEKATKLAKDAEYKVLGAIGLAPLILANAGVLKGKRVTSAHPLAGPVRAKELEDPDHFLLCRILLRSFLYLCLRIFFRRFLTTLPISYPCDS